jgi:hypothetical protein
VSVSYFLGIFIIQGGYGKLKTPCAFIVLFLNVYSKNLKGWMGADVSVSWFNRNPSNRIMWEMAYTNSS